MPWFDGHRGSAARGLGLVGLALLGACDGGGTPDDGEPGLQDNFGVEEDQGTEGCENLLPDDCMYPFPSAAFLADTEDGPSLVLPPEAVPDSALGTFSTEGFTRFEAFGAASPVVFRLSGAQVPELTVFDPTSTLGPDAQTVMIDASTGERIPHWLETDYLAENAGAEEPLFTLRPSVPLPRDTTIVVGLRGFVTEDGSPWETTEAFKALRDGEASTWRGVHARRQHFEDVVFPTLTDAGLSRDELQLAWSFPVRSTASSTARMLAVRDAIFDALPAEGPDVVLDRVLVCDGLDDGVEDDPDCPSQIRVLVDGTIDVPSVVVPADELGIRTLRLDAGGQPVVEGVESWPFRLQIPHAAFEGDGPVPVMQYGHGFLGSLDEANNGWLRDMADRLGFAILATSMQGMNRDDFNAWTAGLVQDGGRFPDIADLAMQGVTNQLVQQRMMSTTMVDLDEPAFEREDGQLAWDPDAIWYYGNSQGGSVGTVVMGTTLDVQRGVLGVPGSGYPFLLHRSSVFVAGFDDLLQAAYPAADSVPQFLALLGTGFDDFDPLTFAPHLHGDPLPGTPDHDVLLHIAKEDRQVGNEASFILGRGADAVLMTPAVRPVWGLPEQSYPASPGAAVVEVDFSIPDDPTPLDPPPERPELDDGGDTHGWLRKWPPAQDQMVHFLATGEMIDVCGGEACVTEGEP